MNADLRSHGSQLDPRRLEVPEAARARLRLRLGQSLGAGEVWEASFCYGVSPHELGALVERWYDELELPSQLLDLPYFETCVAGQHLGFVHARSTRHAAVPLLLLHGYTGSVLELGGLSQALTDAGCDVVCPALPGFGLSGAAPCASSFAEACASLMQRLGYQRYAVHGSDLGASLALRLGAADASHVAGLHVSHVPAYPSEDELETLTTHEKSRLARLSELHEQLQFQLPESPAQALAFALSRLDDAAGARPDLLAHLTLAWALGDATSRAALYRASCLAPAPPSRVPVTVHELPLGVPNLRRFAERAHRVVEWREYEAGGPAPGIEQPQRLLQALTEFCERLR